MSELNQKVIIKLVREIVDKTVMEQDDKEELFQDILEVANKIKFPDNYCADPECLERMFWKDGGFVCPKCGVKQVTVIPPSPAPVQKTIVTTPPEPVKNPKRAATIRELANRMSGGSKAEPAIPVDNTPLPGATSKDINWV